jgi:hypothetical protein
MLEVGGFEELKLKTELVFAFIKRETTRTAATTSVHDGAFGKRSSSC